jgi:hypothetical protein
MSFEGVPEWLTRAQAAVTSTAAAHARLIQKFMA